MIWEEELKSLFRRECSDCLHANKKTLEKEGEGHCKIVPEWEGIKEGDYTMAFCVKKETMP